MLVLHPAISKAMRLYRANGLEQAMLNAASVGLPGAIWGWETTGRGYSAGSDAKGDLGSEAHISSDISFAFQQFWRATKDKTSLSAMAYPVVKNTARYWAARATIDSNGQAHIRDIQPADEWHSHVNDSAFTNAGAIATLHFAADTAEMVGDTSAPVGSWRALADKLVFIHNSSTGATAEYEGFDGGSLNETGSACPVITPVSIKLGTPCIKQADTTLLQYPLGFKQPPGQAERNLKYYAPRIDPHGTPVSTLRLKLFGRDESIKF